MPNTVTLPLKDQLLLAMKVGETSIEGAEYLLKRFKEIVERAKMKEGVGDMIERLEKYTELVKMRLSRSRDAWLGAGISLSDHQNMQENLANRASQALITLGVPEDLQLDIAIKDSSQVLRAYSEGGKELEPEKIASLDTLYNAWLAKHNILLKDGILYKTDKDGIILKNGAGEDITADPEETRTLIDNVSQGYKKFVQDKGISSLTIQQHIMPVVEAPAPEAPAPVPAQPVATAEAPEAPAPEQPVQKPGAGVGPSSS